MRNNRESYNKWSLIVHVQYLYIKKGCSLLILKITTCNELGELLIVTFLLRYSIVKFKLTPS